MTEKIPIKIKRIESRFNDIPLPSYSTEGSSGMDIRAAVKEELLIEPGQITLVPTNLSVEIPVGYEIQVRPRSGLAAKYGIGVLNSPGTIDSDYRGEVKIILINFGKEKFKIESDDLNSSSRGSGGFGHTGQK